jgi:hypothetical protein
MDPGYQMTDKTSTCTSRVVSALQELIGALDRRVPHPERSGEIRIARDAQMLRRKAVSLIEALTPKGPGDKPYDLELVDAVMTDDGSPSPESEPTMRS